MVEDQNDIKLPRNDLKQPTLGFCFWIYIGPLEPFFDLDFNELEDTHTCSNAYAMQKGFSIRYR
jgi:hypothetical protein